MATSSALIPRKELITSPTSSLLDVNSFAHRALQPIDRIDRTDFEYASSIREPKIGMVKRSSSAHSMSKVTNPMYYQRCIEYLQEQHASTLQSLHKEVQELKYENKKLHFKILVENSGGANQIIKESIKTKKDSLVDQDVLQKETIKELRVKLKLSEDSNSHLNQTVKNLNKKLHVTQRHPTQSQTDDKDALIASLQHTNAIYSRKIDDLTFRLKDYERQVLMLRNNLKSKSSGLDFTITNSPSTTHTSHGYPHSPKSSRLPTGKLPPLVNHNTATPPNTSPRISTSLTSSYDNSRPRNDIAQRVRRTKAVKKRHERDGGDMY